MAVTLVIGPIAPIPALVTVNASLECKALLSLDISICNDRDNNIRSCTRYKLIRVSNNLNILASSEGVNLS